MKKTIVILILLALGIKLSAQINVFTNFNDTHSGRSISLLISKKINDKYEFGGGIKYNINRIKQSDDQNNVFKNRLYATKPYQYIGLNAFVNRTIFQKWDKIDPFIFYDVQLCHSTTRNSFFIPFSSDSIHGKLENLYLQKVTNFGPFFWFEQNVGVGFKADLFKSVYMIQRIGIGIDMIMGYDEHLIAMRSKKFAWEFGGLVNVGFGVHF